MAYSPSRLCPVPLTDISILFSLGFFWFMKFPFRSCLCCFLAVFLSWITCMRIIFCDTNWFFGRRYEHEIWIRLRYADPKNRRVTIVERVLFLPQTRRCVGQDRGLVVCHRWCVDHCVAGACHSVEFQLFLSSWDRSGGDAVAELQPRDQLPISARHFRPTHEEELAERVVQRPGGAGGGPAGDAGPARPKAELQSAPQQQHQRHEHWDWRLTTR